MKVKMTIEGETTTGSIHVHGEGPANIHPLDDCRIYQWLLGEALRLCERRSDKRDASQTDSGLVIAKANPGLES